MNDKDEVRKLEEEYNSLKEQDDIRKERAMLRKKIWSLKHKKFVNLGLALDNIYKGTKEMILKGAEKKKPAKKYKMPDIP